MYHPRLIAARDAQVLADPRFGPHFPNGFPQYSLADARAITADIVATRDETGTPIRSMTDEEDTFVAMAQIRTKYDVPFYLQTFVVIDEEGHGIRPLTPFWESQQFVLDRLASLELQRIREKHRDGLLLNILKARQLGISTLGMALVSHRIFCREYIRAIAGSDTEEQARYLFRMVERIFEHLPWFLKPERAVPYNAGRELHLSNHSSIKTAWGKTTRGALQEVGGRKGNIERGRTNSCVHISELATWDNPEQLDSSLLPGIPIDPDVLVLFESTAELAGDWWHQQWLAAEDGEGRFVNQFIPWCVEASKYSSPAPTDWSPSDLTQKVAAQIERDTPRWIGKTLHLTRDQLYWYESTRAYYLKKGNLHTFLKEFPSNPEESFQYAGRSVFTLDELQAIDQAARPIRDVWAVEPSREIAELRHADLDDPKALALLTDRRPAAPMSLRMSVKEAEQYPVPPGYGFRRLSPDELSTLPSLRASVLTIFEYPRARGRRRYYMAVDAGDGIGQDFTVITIVREPTIEEPAEDVAQYVSNSIRPAQIAFIADAIGRFYTDEDGLEAVAAIELEKHGAVVQNLLQLHLGYSNFYVWEVVDAADPSSRYTRRIGWLTSARTRPLLIEKFHDAVTTRDPLSGVADFRLNSTVTRSELHHFVTEGALEDAEHARGQHDDAIFSSAIGYYVAHQAAGGEAEPVAERRRRRDAMAAHLQATGGPKRDFRNSAATADDQNLGVDDAREGIDDDTPDQLFFDDRSRA